MANLFKKKFMKVPNLSLLSSFREIGRNAYVDWIIILILFSLLSLSLAISGLYLYWEISTGNYENSTVAQKNDEKIFNNKDLDDVLMRFDIKKDLSNKLKAGYAGPADPSK